MILLCYLLIPLLVFTLPARAQVILDETMGPIRTLSGPNYAISADLGQQRGTNLFHSFQAFGLLSNELATFSGPPNVQNIIARVTGPDSSTIDGTLRSTIYGANLYFLNPHGIFFGANASLDIQGSFYGSTAQTLKFSDGNQFSTAHPAESTLTSATPEAFGFLEQNPAAIICANCKLSTSMGQTLELVAGEIRVGSASTDSTESTGWSASLEASAGKIALAATTKSSDISVNANVWIKGDADGSITLINSGVGAGLPINPNNNGGSGFGNSNQPPPPGGNNRPPPPGGNNRPPPPGGNNQPFPPGSNNQPPPEQAVDTPEVDTSIVIMGGIVDLNGSEITDQTYVADSRTIHIIAQNLFLHGTNPTLPVEGYNSSISTSTKGSGKSGSIFLEIAGDLILNDKALISSGSEHDMTIGMPVTGDGGNITINAGNIEVLGTSRIDSTTRGAGQGGNLSITTTRLLVSGHEANGHGSHLFSAVWDDATGNGGNIAIQADELILRDGGSISTETKGMANAGNINIVAKSISLDGESADGAKLSSIYANSQSQYDRQEEGRPKGNLGRGDAGDITLDTHALTLRNGASIASTTNTKGKSGNITINSEDLVVDGTTIHHAQDGPQAGAEVMIPSSINTQSFEDGTGKAGDITISQVQNLEVLNGASINTSAKNADGGDIKLNIYNFLYLHKGEIRTDVQGIEKAGGNIIIDPQFIILNQGQLITKAPEGFGGDITIQANAFLRSANSTIDPSGGLKNGSLHVAAPNQITNSSVAALPSDYLDIDRQLSRNCKPRERGSQLLVRPIPDIGDVVNDWTY